MDMPLNGENHMEDPLPHGDIPTPVSENQEEHRMGALALEESPNLNPAVDMEELQLVFPIHRSSASKHEVTFRCSLCLPPEMLKYYHSPGPDGYHEGKPILHGSPQFDGGWGTKWQVSFTFDRWIGMKRWMSLYLTRLDNLDFWDLKLQCEFKVLGAQGNMLYAARNTLEPTSKGETAGFTEFLPFEQVVKMVCNDNTFHIVAHLTLLLQTYLDSNYIPQDVLKENNENGNSGVSTLVEEGDLQDNWSVTTVEGFVPGVGIEEDDRVEFCHEDVFVTYASREKLLVRSPAYAQCIELDWEPCATKVNLQRIFGNDAKERKILNDYVNFIHDAPCRTLESGSYADIHLLLNFAKKMETKDLISRCLTAMTMMLTHSTAALHVAVIINNFGFVDKDNLEISTKYFKELSRKQTISIKYGKQILLSNWRTDTPSISSISLFVHAA